MRPLPLPTPVLSRVAHKPLPVPKGFSSSSSGSGDEETWRSAHHSDEETTMVDDDDDDDDDEYGDDGSKSDDGYEAHMSESGSRPSSPKNAGSKASKEDRGAPVLRKASLTAKELAELAAAQQRAVEQKSVAQKWALAYNSTHEFDVLGDIVFTVRSTVDFLSVLHKHPRLEYPSIVCATEVSRVARCSCGDCSTFPKSSRFPRGYRLFEAPRDGIASRIDSAAPDQRVVLPRGCFLDDSYDSSPFSIERRAEGLLPLGVYDIACPYYAVKKVPSVVTNDGRFGRVLKQARIMMHLNRRVDQATGEKTAWTHPNIITLEALELREAAGEEDAATRGSVLGAGGNTSAFIINPRELRVPVYDDAYLFTPLMHTDLAALLAGAQEISIAMVQVIMYQLVRALHYIHSANIVHGNICPANILLTEHCYVKIMGFGDALPCESDALFVEHGRPMLEVTASKGHLAPEIIAGCRTLGPHCDIWSCGMLCAEMASQGTPLIGKEDDSVLGLFARLVELFGVPSHDAMNNSSTPGFEYPQAAQAAILDLPRAQLRPPWPGLLGARHDDAQWELVIPGFAAYFQDIQRTFTINSKTSRVENPQEWDEIDKNLELFRTSWHNCFALLEKTLQWDTADRYDAGRLLDLDLLKPLQNPHGEPTIEQGFDWVAHRDSLGQAKTTAGRRNELFKAMCECSPDPVAFAAARTANDG